MKKFLVVIALLAVAGVLLMPVRSYAQATDPLSVLNASIASLNAGNVEANLALFADDAVVTITTPTPGQPSSFVGKDQIRAWDQGQVAGHQHLTVVGTPQVSGNKVTLSGTISNDTFRKLGFDSLGFNGEVTVQDGKIKTLSVGLDQASLAKVIAASSARPTMPKTGSTADYTWLLALSALVIAAGLVARRYRPRQST
jgi:LPXTG-motif cell wall-anchored protein